MKLDISKKYLRTTLDNRLIVDGECNMNIGNTDYAVVEIECNGFSPVCSEPIKISATKVHDFEVTDTFETFVHCTGLIQEYITKLTGITDRDVEHALSEGEALGELKSFIGNAVLSIWHPDFEKRLLGKAGKRFGLDYNTMPCVNICALVAAICPEVERCTDPETVASSLGIQHDEDFYRIKAHVVIGEILAMILRRASEKGFVELKDINALTKDNPYYAYRYVTCDCSIVLNTQRGREEIGRCLKESEDYLPKGSTARIPMCKLIELQKNGDILLGSKGMPGEVTDAILKGYDFDELCEIAKRYDYLGLPSSKEYDSYKVLSFSGAGDLRFKNLETINKEIVKLGESLDLPVVENTI